MGYALVIAGAAALWMTLFGVLGREIAPEGRKDAGAALGAALGPLGLLLVLFLPRDG